MNWRKCKWCWVFGAILVLLNLRLASVNGDESGETVSIKISFAGDCTLGSDLSYGKGNSFMEVFERQDNPYGYFFENVKHIFEEDDLTIVNLEGPLTNAETGVDKEFVFKGRPEFVNILKEGHVQLVNLANNHIMDYGRKGYADTIYQLDSVGIAFYDSDKPYITEIKGIKVGVLGYKGWGVYSGLKNKIAQDIASVREAGASIVITTFHWGEERVHYPNDTQKTLGRFAIDSGADLVVGHHPHVVQGIEQYQGRYIVYSLGNFSYGGNRNPADKDTFIFQQDFEFYRDTLERVEKGGKVHIYPCSISSVNNRNNFQPTPLIGDEAQRVMSRLTEYSLPLNDEDIIAKIAASNIDADSEETI